MIIRDLSSLIRNHRSLTYLNVIVLVRNILFTPGIMRTPSINMQPSYFLYGKCPALTPKLSDTLSCADAGPSDRQLTDPPFRQ